MTRAQRRIRARKMAAVAPFGLTWTAPAVMTNNPNRGRAKVVRLRQRDGLGHLV